MHPASKFSFPALDPCSDSHLLGVSAVKLDAPHGLISGSPIFLVFKLTSGSWHNFFLISRCLEFNCIAFVHQFLFNSCSALICVLHISNTIWASCSTSVLVQNVLWQIHFLRTSPAFQLILLLDCWFLLRAPCCRIPRSADTHTQELQVPSIITFQTSHTSCLHDTCWRQQQKFTGTIKLADKKKTPRIHLIFSLAPSSEWFCPKHTSPNGTTSPAWSLPRIER